MIIDSNLNFMVNHADTPPPYEDAPKPGPSGNVAQPSSSDGEQRSKSLPQPDSSSAPLAAFQVVPVPVMPEPRVYHYQNPVTMEHIASLLPPDHPEMVCLQQGGHIPHTKFGLLGILAAIVWFPLGIGLCLLDRRVQCKRCGVVIDPGCCG